MLGEISESPRVAARIASPSSSGPASLSRKPRRAGPQGAVDVLVQVEGGDDDDRDRVLDARSGQLPGRLHAVEDRHPDVHQADVGTQLASQPHRLPPVARLPHDLDAVQRAEDQPKPGAHQVLVVGDQHPDGHAGTSRGSVASTAQPRPGTGPPGTCRRAAWPARPSRSARSPTPAWPGGRSGHRRRSTCSCTDAGVAGDAHVDARGVPGVAPGVGDSLLRDPEERRVHRRREIRQVTGERHLDPRPGRRGADQPLDVGDSRLRGVVGGRPRCAAPAPWPASRRACATPPASITSRASSGEPGLVAASARPA